MHRWIDRIERRAGRLGWWIAGGILLFVLSLAWPLPRAAAPGEAVASLRLTDRDGRLLREVWPDGRGRPVPLADVHPAAVQALVATEDRFFWQHPGVNPLALVRATEQNVRAGRVVSGGSTVTMQVARRLRGPGASRTLWNKALEAHLALRLSLRRSKREVLSMWLGRVSYGNRAVGIEAAARLYFGKSARALTMPEAAYLIGLPQRPARYDPFRHPAQAKARQRRVLQAMARAGHLPAAEAERLAALPLAVQEPAQVFRAPHFTEALLADGAAGRAVEVRTTLDLDLQRTVEQLARGHLAALGESVTNAAVVVLENETGAVRAYVGSADFWNEATGGQNDGVQMLRQPGSALKPFTYAQALASRRYTPATILPDLPLQVLEAGGAFSPANYDERFHGPVPLRQALASSYNVPAVRLAREIGPPALLEAYHRAGFASLDRPARHYGVGLTLGSGEVRLLELARAYAGLARGGLLSPVRRVAWRRTRAGDTLRADPFHAARPSGLSPQVAHLITDMLKDPEARAPGFGRGGPLELPFPAAAKTGTSKDFRDNWTVGYTPAYTVAVWTGNFDGAPMQWVSGVSGAGPLFGAVMRALEARPGGAGGSFAQPDGLVERVVCPASGQRPGAHCPTRRRSLFLPGTAPTDTCQVHRPFRLDRRTGLRAAPGAPPESVHERVFAVYPPAYHGWMRAQGLPLPPSRTAAAGRGAPVRPASHGRSSQSKSSPAASPLQVQYPASGTRYRFDPVLRRAFQKVELRGAASTPLRDVHWRVDGERLPGDWRKTAWPLEAGTHRITLHATDPQGRALHSPPSVVTVESAR